MLKAEKRKYKREPINWTANVYNSNLILNGLKVCDISRTGIFVCSVVGEKLLQAGEPLNITLFPPIFPRGMVTTGVVRWVGNSYSHECAGIGIQFSDSPRIERSERSPIPRYQLHKMDK
jgi:hypothetical protein